MIVALLTDFGTRDHYVGVMKAVIVSVCPDATLVDITHDIPPQDIHAAAWELAAAYRYFPAGTVFLVVVDPGVGTARRAMAVDAGGYRFVGPDNGVMSLAFSDAGGGEAVELTQRRFARPVISNTFEGRDRFAPAAGWLARGTALREFGPPILDPVVLTLPAPRISDACIEGQVVRVDRFGNLITNIRDDRLAARAGRVMLAGHDLGRIVTTYADVAPGTTCALIGSSGFLEIAVRNGNAAETLRAECGTPIRVA